MTHLVLLLVFASPASDPVGDDPAAPPYRFPAMTARDASDWLVKGNGAATVADLRRASGVSPAADAGGYRWAFADGVLLTGGRRLPNGDFLIGDWGLRDR